VRLLQLGGGPLRPGTKPRVRLPLIVPIAAVVVLAAGGVLTVEERFFRAHAQHQRAERAAAVADEAGGQLRALRRVHETYARLLADTPGLARDVERGRRANVRHVLEPIQLNQAFEEITVYDAEATELVHLGAPKGDRIDASLFTTGVAGRTTSRALIDPAGLIILASTPLRASGRVVGVAVVASTFVGADLALLKRQQGAELALFQRSNLVTTSVRNPQLVGVLARATLSGDELRRLERRLDTFGFYGSVEPLTGGALLALTSTVDLDAAASQRRRVVLGAMLLLLIAIGVIGSFVAHTVTRPLRAMARVTERMLGGDYDGRIAPSRIPELDALASVVNHLAEEAQGRAQVEEQLRQSQKMDAVGRLAGGVAHDFNNLLTAIGGRSELALMKLGDRDPIRADVEEILEATERAASLTRQLLAFSRKQVIEPKVLDLNAVVSGSERLLRRVVGEDVEFVSSLDPAIGCVKADAGQLEQVVMNLVLNARDAMPNGGRVIVETRNVDASEAGTSPLDLSEGSWVALVVSDAGTGMDADTRRRIFEPFFTTKEPGKGTGLGLSTVHGIVEQSGGHIRVESEPGHGTTFTIYLPQVAASAEEPRTRPVAPPERGSETILLVEDEDLVRSLVREMLESGGYTVLEASDPSEAVRICGQAGRIDMMMTDVVLPGLSGPDLAARLAPLRPKLPVLYMSGYTEDAVLQRGLLSSDTWFLQKPFTTADLAGKAREVLDAA
jgi:signal transduction histidine kinase